MTPAAKREHRQVRHEAQRQAERMVNKRIGLHLTPVQVKAAARKVTDQYLSQRLHG